MPLTLSAIVLNYRDPQNTIRCVRALQQQIIGNQIEIIVVDNHSQTDAIQTLRNRLSDDANVRIIESGRNTGYGQGNNIGVRHAHGEFILIINPDTSLQPEAAAIMMQFLQDNTDVGIVGPQLILPDGSIRDSFRTFPRLLDVFIKRTWLRNWFPGRMRSYLQWDEDPHTTRDVDWLAGACLMMRKTLYEELDGFDPRFFLFFEDTDLCRRCWNAGKRVVYLPAAKAHDGVQRLSSGGLFSIFTKKTVRIHIGSAMRYFLKYR